MKQEDEEHVWNLIAKKLNAEAVESVLEELNKLYVEHPSLANSFSVLSEYWNLCSTAGEEDVNTSAAFEKL